MGELVAHFANCPMLGEEYTVIDGHRRLDTIRIDQQGFQFRIVQRPDSLGSVSGHRNQFHPTTDVFVREVDTGNLNTVQNLLHELSRLLSFATYSNVVYFGYDFQHGTTLGERWSVSGRLRHFRPLIEMMDGKAVREFLERAWPMYSHIWKPRRLNIIIHYILLADRPEQPLEAALVLSFVALESLKSTFATVENIPFVKGRFRKISNPPKPNPRNEPSFSFEDLLTAMPTKVGMHNTPIGQIVALRNEIIHNGITQQSDATNRRIFNSCQDLLREYLLRLLGYHGPFWLYSAPNGPRGNI